MDDSSSYDLDIESDSDSESDSEQALLAAMEVTATILNMKKAPFGEGLFALPNHVKPVRRKSYAASSA